MAILFAKHSKSLAKCPNSALLTDVVPIGLDAVELVLAIEKVFDIEIPDEAVGKIVTVGEPHEVDRRRKGLQWVFGQ